MRPNYAYRRTRVMELKSKGLTSTQIGERLGISADLVRYFLKPQPMAQDAAPVIVEKSKSR